MYCAGNENMAGQLNIISCLCARNTANCSNLYYIKKCTGLIKISNCNYYDISVYTISTICVAPQNISTLLR